MAENVITGAHTLLLFIIMALVTIWISNLMLKAVDILYKPQVHHWVHNKAPIEFSDTCKARDASDCGKVDINDLTTLYDDEYIAKLQKELKVLKAMRQSRSWMRKNANLNHETSNHVKSVRNSKFDSSKEEYCEIDRDFCKKPVNYDNYVVFR